MKHPYRFILSSVVLSSALAFAQATEAQPAVPQAEAAPQPQATAPAAPAPQAATPAPAAPAPQAATPETAAPAVQSAAPEAAPQTAPAETPQAAPEAPKQAAADSSAAKPEQPAVAEPKVAPEQTAEKAPETKPTEAADSATNAAVQTAEAAQNAEQKVEPKAEPAAPAEPAPQMLSGTEIGGNVHGLLAAENSPYLVISDITVDEQNALFIQAGVTLLFKPGTGLYVRNGSLTVAGNSTAPVTFRSALEPSKPGSWKGVFLTGQNEFNFFKANISDAEVGIAIEKGSLSLQASQIANTSSRGVYVRDAKASITAATSCV